MSAGILLKLMNYETGLIYGVRIFGWTFLVCHILYQITEKT